MGRIFNRGEEEEDNFSLKEASDTLASYSAAGVDQGVAGPTLCFPSNLEDQLDKGRECMRISIVSRDKTEKKAIFLLIPPGLNVPDGSSWNNVDMGTLVGGALGVGDKAKRAIQKLKAGGGAESPVSVQDFVAASTLTAAERFAPTLLGTKGMMTAGLAANPYTSTQFAGTNLRTFEFTFKMIPESEDEAKVGMQIENTFRKFLYPRTHPESDLVLVYPPLWKIDFLYLHEGIISKNPHLPLIHFCNLSNLSVTYNATGNSFHKDGSPTEIDMSLSFMETKVLTRGDLYQESGGYGQGELNYGNVNYDHSKVSLTGDPAPDNWALNYVPDKNISNLV